MECRLFARQQLPLNPCSTKDHGETEASQSNPLRTFFESHRDGAGIWKWTHYFDAYHRHLHKFVGHAPAVLEIGIYSGGSIEMWKSYFGPKTHIFGCDIEEACRKYASDDVTVFIGDQADRNFWSTVKEEVPPLNVVIDDGGHSPEQQMVTIEEMLPFLAPGGVFIARISTGNGTLLGTSLQR